jgi:hypothetical protein
VVRALLDALVVYRRFDAPRGLVKTKVGQPFSIRGYFVPTQSSGYKFMTYNPTRQSYEVSNVRINSFPTENHFRQFFIFLSATLQNLTLAALEPQITLDSKAFRNFYANEIEVLKANDLSVYPSAEAPCVNVLVQDQSMYAVVPDGFVASGS